MNSPTSIDCSDSEKETKSFLTREGAHSYSKHYISLHYSFLVLVNYSLE